MILWPIVAQRLVTLLPTLSGWSGVAVYDGASPGQGSGVAPSLFAVVGAADPEGDAGDFSHTPRGADYRVREEGRVRCEVVAWTGEASEAAFIAQRARVFALLDPVEAYIRAHPDLGVLRPGAASQLAAAVYPTYITKGTSVRALVTVSYESYTE